MLYTVDELQKTLRDDLMPSFAEIGAAPDLHSAILAHGLLMGRLVELERLGVLQRGQRQAWLADAADAFTVRRKAFIERDVLLEAEIKAIEDDVRNERD